jgi:Flp pilus assembly protein TadD
VRLQERLRVLEQARLRGKEKVGAVPAGVWLALGSAHFRTQQIPEAELSFREALKIDPKLGPAHNNLAVIHMLRGEYADARESLKRAERAGVLVSAQFKADLEQRSRQARP